MGAESFFIKINFLDNTTLITFDDIIEVVKRKHQYETILKKERLYMNKIVEIWFEENHNREITLTGVFKRYDESCIIIKDIVDVINSNFSISYIKVFGKQYEPTQIHNITDIIKTQYNEKYTWFITNINDRSLDRYGYFR